MWLEPLGFGESVEHLRGWTIGWRTIHLEEGLFHEIFLI